MKILLANAPWYQNNKRGVRAGSRWPHLRSLNDGYRPFPFFLAYASSLLKNNGFDVKLIDAIGEDLDYDHFYRLVEDYAPRIVLLEVSTPSIDNDLKIAEVLKERLNNKVQIVFAGPHYEMYKEDFLNRYHFVDFVIYGEYELSLLSLVQTLQEKSSLKNVQGILYRCNEKTFKTSPRELIQNLDILPFPDRESLPVDKYIDLPHFLPQPLGIILSSRGCPLRCNFCLWNWVLYGGPNYRRRSVSNVVREIEFILEKFNFRSIYFDDDIFNIDENWLIQFAEELKKRKINVKWAVMAKPDLTSLATWEKLWKAGLRAVKFGIETFSPQVLRKYDKIINYSYAIATIKFLKSLGIKVHLTFMISNFDNKESLRMFKEKIEEIQPDSYQISHLIPFPGTPFYEKYIGSSYWQK